MTFCVRLFTLALHQKRAWNGGESKTSPIWATAVGAIGDGITQAQNCAHLSLSTGEGDTELG